MKIRALGRVDYESTWQQMRDFTDARTSESEDELWIVEHDPVFTQGIAGKAEHLLINPTSIPVVKTDRGGQITYHGPGQTVVYVMFDLKRAGYGVRELVVRIENAVIELLKDFGVEAFGKRDAPGVYVHYSLSRSAGEGWGEGDKGNMQWKKQRKSVDESSLSRSAGEGWSEGGSTEFPGRILPARELPEDLKRLARAMRTNDTDAENRIWYCLRNRQMNGRKFRRQHPIGRFILDFYCDELKLAIELDGGQHSEMIEADAARTKWLNEQGISVVRFWNDEVYNNLDGVLHTIYCKTVGEEIGSAEPTPVSSSKPLSEGLSDRRLRVKPQPHLVVPPSPQPSPAHVSDRQNDAVNRSLTVASPSSQPSPALRERGHDEAKIASLGLKIRNGRSYHGVALNVDMDLVPFSFINPCGYEGLRVTHLHDFGVDLPANDVAEIGKRLSAHLVTALTAPA